LKLEINTIRLKIRKTNKESPYSQPPLTTFLQTNIMPMEGNICRNCLPNLAVRMLQDSYDGPSGGFLLAPACKKPR